MLAHGEGADARPHGWPAALANMATGPTDGAAPETNPPDRTIYDTARRIWKRLSR
jgi:hypothetical protein